MSWDRQTFDEGNLEVWRALEDAQTAGKVESIGVSNFQEADLQNILDKGIVKPAVNQILTHVGNTSYALIDFCKANDVLVEAYSPTLTVRIWKMKPLLPWQINMV